MSESTELSITSEYLLPDYARMRSDVRALSQELDPASVRSLVDMYYILQKNRMAFASQARELEEAESPHSLVAFYSDRMYDLETSLKYPLRIFAQQFLVGRWALSQYGIGPIITSGLLSMIDITKAPTAGAVWRYAGLDPTSVWEKGQKPPYNQNLKNLSWKIGQSFMKFASRDNCFYGKLYLHDKERRTELNETGEYKERAEKILQQKNWKAQYSKSILESGKLPPAQIDAQARRYAVKIFLSHYHAVAFQDHYCTPAPTPYVIAHGDHVHEIAIPNNPFA